MLRNARWGRGSRRYGTSEQVRANKQAQRSWVLCKAQTAAAAGLRRGFATPHSTQLR